MKTLCFTIPKKTRKKPHQRTKANRCRHYSSESLEDKDEYDDVTSVKDVISNVRGEKNTDAIRGPVEWIRFLSLMTQIEASGAMAKASSLTALRKTKLGKRKKN